MIYFGDFKSFDDIMLSFCVGLAEQESIDKILFASYETDGYDGSAFVLFRGVDGVIYEVNGSHCSCYGLEDQWEPEPIVLKELKNRITYNSYLTSLPLKDILDVL